MKIIAFGASYSRASINKTFAAYTAKQFNNAEIEVLDLNDFDLPLFTIDKEQEIGQPDAAKRFIEKLAAADLIIISLAEHNGTYSTGFKNLFDWASRVKLKMFEEKKVLLLATAPGPGGGKWVLETAKTRFPRHGAEILADFYLPQFNHNFSIEEGIVDPEFKAAFDETIAFVKEKLSEKQSV